MKIENARFLFACSCCHQIFKFYDFTLSGWREPQTYLLKSVLHLQHGYLMQLNVILITELATKSGCLPCGVCTEFGHFDTKLFRYKSTRYQLKSFRDIIKVDSIYRESRFNSNQLNFLSGPTGAKIISVNQ